MKVGIFGDSHGDCTYLAWKKKYPDLGPGWPELLADTRSLSVTNFSLGGSGTYYSYKLFLKNHTKFDKIIFIPSQHGRFDLKLSNEVVQIIPGFVHAIEPMLEKFSKHSIDYKVLSAAIEYCKYAIDFEKEQIFNDLLLKDILDIRPDTIIVPAFRYISFKFPEDCIPLTELSIIEDEMMGITRTDLRRGPPVWDIRKCHITEEHNDVLYKKLLFALDNNQRFAYLTKDDLVKPKKPSSFYFKPTDNGMPGNV